LAKTDPQSSRTVSLRQLSFLFPGAAAPGNLGCSVIYHEIKGYQDCLGTVSVCPEKETKSIFYITFNKFPRISIAFSKQNLEFTEILSVERVSTSPNQCCHFTLQTEKIAITASQRQNGNGQYARISLEIARNCLYSQHLKRKNRLTLINSSDENQKRCSKCFVHHRPRRTLADWRRRH